MSEVKKVLQVFGSLNIGGAESRMMDVYRRINKDLVQFDFITMQTGPQFFEKEILSLGGRVYRVKQPREVGIVRHLRDLRKIMRKEKYCAVHAHTSYHCGLVMFAAWMEHIPIRISHARTTKLTKESVKERMMLSLGRILIKAFATCKLAISKDAGSFLFMDHSFTVVPNAIETNKYIVDYNKDKIRRKMGIPADAIVIGQIGRFDKGKNYQFTIGWFLNFLNRKPLSILILVGDGETKQHIQELVEHNNLAERVVFTGVRDDIPEFIHVLDVLIFPSLYEGLGGVALEAQAAGVPVVESDGIPVETDVGIGMVERCSLDSPYSSWDNAILKSIGKRIPTADERLSAFSAQGLTIESVVNSLIKIYSGELI